MKIEVKGGHADGPFLSLCRKSNGRRHSSLRVAGFCLNLMCLRDADKVEPERFARIPTGFKVPDVRGHA